DIIRRLLRGERVTVPGEFTYVDDAVLLPAVTPPPLMVGSIGDRVLRATLPFVDAWNCWYAWFGNTPEGFAALNSRVTALARECGRDPATITRPATVFVSLDASGSDRPHADAAPITGTARDIADRLAALRSVGVEEAILVVSPIDEQSIRTLGDVLILVRND